MCVVYRMWDELDKVLCCWGWREGDLGGGGLEKEMDWWCWSYAEGRAV